MKTLCALTALALACPSRSAAGAQVPPAPVLSKEIDSYGRPVPFGRAPRQPRRRRWAPASSRR
jgi:hypothetical protein